MVDGDHRVAIVANRDVAAGDELFYNYNYDKRVGGWVGLGAGPGADLARVSACSFCPLRETTEGSSRLTPTPLPAVRPAGGSGLGGGHHAAGGRAARGGGQEECTEAAGQPGRRRQRPGLTDGSVPPPHHAPAVVCFELCSCSTHCPSLAELPQLWRHVKQANHRSKAARQAGGQARLRNRGHLSRPLPPPKLGTTPS